MSVTAVKDKGVAVVTVASDDKSVLPLLCQILKWLCHQSPCCSKSKGLMQSPAVSALTNIQILVGLFNIGLGAGRQQYDDLAYEGAAYWLGGLYIAVGVLTLLADRFPFVVVVFLAAIVNIIGSLVAIVGIALYAKDLEEAPLVSQVCRWGNQDAPEHLNDNCMFVAQVVQRMLTAIDITMIILAVLQMCVCISLAVLAVKALISPQTDEVDGDVEIYQPLTKNLKTSLAA